jgi:hypothetical protein
MKKRIGIILLLIGLLSGCLGGTGKTPFVRQYVLEYPPPQGGARPAVEAMVRVERFSADRMFMGPAMLYRQGPFLRDAYPAQRWRVEPGDMVTEFLRRDLREAGLFRAVLSDREAEDRESQGHPDGDDHPAGSLPEGDGRSGGLSEDLPA